MKGQLLEALFYTAIALSVTEWGFKGNPDNSLSNTYNPSDLLNGQADIPIDAASQNQPLATTTFKEEQNILNTIINWEESQRIRYRQNNNFFAYPLISQSSDGQSYDSDSGSYSHSPEFPVQQPQPVEGYGASPPWTLNPPSPIDDGELFGAVGYTPLSSNQYFDIESFLTADFPVESPRSANPLDSLSEDGYLGAATAASPRWMEKRINSVTSEQSETLEDLAEFLESSIQTKDEFNPKKTKFQDFNKYPNPDIPIEIPQTFDDIYLGGQRSFYEKSGAASKVASDASKISEIGLNDLLKDDYYGSATTSKSKGTANLLADIQSYDHVRREPSFGSDQTIKKEPLSPYGSEFSWGKSTDCDPSGYSSNSPGSSSGQYPDDVKSSKKSRQNKQIWLDLPYTKDDLINAEIEGFNDIIAKLDPLQQHIAKDIRRKGKNKLAARNCRKRKIDAIDQLGSGVNTLESQRQQLLDERLQLQLQKEEIARKTDYLYEHIFKHLRDERGVPYSREQYALTYTTDGSVYLVPKQAPITEEIGSR